MNNQALLKYSGPVPRYTSYPTATNFTSAVGPQDYRSWLGELGGEDSLSLYFHVPFCRSLCWFCGCHTTVTNDPRTAKAYAELLTSELRLVGEATPLAGPINHIHWGGGTPTEIGEQPLRHVMGLVADLFDFTPNAEIAIEIDPRSFLPGFAETLASLGFNRASLGVQDIDPGIQAAVNRIQPLGVTRAATDALRANGIEHLNVDLMIGLPGQTEAGVRRSVAATIAAIRPNRVSVFAYAHVPWMKRHQQLIDETALPDAEARLAQTQIAEETLVEHGYVPIGLDHFALPEDRMAGAARSGVLRRNFQGYVTDHAAALIGIGASAISSLPRGYGQNAAKVPDYRRAIEAGEFAVSRGVTLTQDDRVRRDIIERLMCDLGIDLDEVSDRWRVSPHDFDGALATLAPMVEEGLVNMSDARIEVHADARPVIRAVCAAFDTYLRPSESQHSAGI